MKTREARGPTGTHCHCHCHRCDESYHIHTTQRPLHTAHDTQNTRLHLHLHQFSPPHLSSPLTCGIKYLAARRDIRHACVTRATQGRLLICESVKYNMHDDHDRRCQYAMGTLDPSRFKTLQQRVASRAAPGYQPVPERAVVCCGLLSPVQCRGTTGWRPPFLCHHLPFRRGYGQDISDHGKGCLLRWASTQIELWAGAECSRVAVLGSALLQDLK